MVGLNPELWIPCTGLKYGSFGWCCLGVGIAEFGVENRRLPKWLVATIGGLYFATSLFVASGGVAGSRMVPILGILFWWGLYDWLMSSDGQLPTCFSMTFWVYCLHGVITAWFLASTGYIFGKTSFVAIFASCFSVVGSLAICLAMGIWMKRSSPKAYAILCGGR